MSGKYEMNPLETKNSEKNTHSAFSPLLFKGKKVLVTGASRGIGRACALSFGRLGADLAILSRRPEGLCRLKADLDEISSNLLIVDEVIDVAQPQALKDCMKRVKEKLGRVDILVNNAGIYITEEVDGHSLAVWQQTLDTNLTSAMVASSCVLEGMVAQKWGRVINISSMSGKVGEAFGSAYSASKFGLLGLTQSMALEVARFGVTVNAICPGWVATDMAFDQIKDPQWCRLNNIEPADSLDIARLSVPQERFIEAAEVAALVTFLATDDARGITGQAINICGGLSIH
jgi:NAD(P)-dependent dehydrogenase (short-subunit alcohol dehydrogenase family)